MQSHNSVRRIAYRLWCRVLIACAAALGFGAACCDQATPVYGILMTGEVDSLQMNVAKPSAGSPADAAALSTSPKQKGDRQ
jgi:hypothetical protein